MKKLLLVALACFAFPSFGQDDRSLWLGINGSVMGGSLFPNNIYVSQVIEMKPDISMNYNMGIEAGYMFHERVGVFVGAGISRYHYTVNPKAHSGREILRVGGATTFLELPVGIRYEYFQRKYYSFFVNAGAKVGLLIDERTDYHFRTTTLFTVKRTLERKDGMEIYNDFALSPFAHLGIQLRAGRFSFNIGPEVSYQFTNLFQNSPEGKSLFSSINHSEWRAHYFNVGVKLNIGFHF